MIPSVARLVKCEVDAGLIVSYYNSIKWVESQRDV